MMAEFDELRQRFLNGKLTEFPQGLEDAHDRVYMPPDETVKPQFAMLQGDFSDAQELFYLLLRGLYEYAQRNTEGGVPDEGALTGEARALVRYHSHPEIGGMRLIGPADMLQAREAADRYIEPLGQHAADTVLALFRLHEARPADFNPSSLQDRQRLN